MSASTFHPAGRRMIAVFCLAGGLFAGAVDVLFAAAYWHADIPQVLRSIASWVLGPAALHGGTGAAWTGACVQAVLMVAMYAGGVAIGRRFPALTAHPLRNGVLYGLALYVLQFGVLVPLSPSPPLVFAPLWTVACSTVYACLVGIPSALVARGAVASRAARTGLHAAAASK